MIFSLFVFLSTFLGMWILALVHAACSSVSAKIFPNHSENYLLTIPPVFLLLSMITITVGGVVEHPVGSFLINALGGVFAFISAVGLFAWLLLGLHSQPKKH